MTTDEIILVSFRGTEAVKDFITDANVDLIAGPLGGEVHEGFSEALTSVWGTIKAMVFNRYANPAAAARLEEEKAKPHGPLAQLADGRSN